MALDEPRDDDHSLKEGGFTWVVDQREAEWILGGAGIVVDWVRGLMGEGLSVRRRDHYGGSC
ncbi:MAG: hypothetical protein P1V51_06840 [Deltaproteobacteria bacterium]|nr:hypothetical protein [Deltaproteobacteria bacterium]